MIKNGKIYQSYKSRAEAAEARAADLLEANRELSEALTTLRAEVTQLEAQIAGTAQVVVTLTRERDEARHKLRSACNEVTDDVTRLSWLQSLITEANKHIYVLSDGDLDAGFTCLREAQDLHDALKAMLDDAN